MRDVINATFYRLRKGKEVFYGMLVVLLFGCSSGFVAYNQGADMKGAIMGSGDNWIFMGGVSTLVVIAIFIGGEFKNKTIYYEIMSGHRSREIVIGRAIPIMLVAVTMLSVNLVASFSLGILFNNWEKMLGSTRETGIRWLLLIGDALPMIGYCILNVFIARSLASALALNWLMFVGLQIPLLFQDLTSYKTSILSYFSIMVNVRGILGASLDLPFVITIILISAIKFILAISLAIIVLNRSDLN